MRTHSLGEEMSGAFAGARALLEAAFAAMACINLVLAAMQLRGRLRVA
jgi:hypothetical protein